MIALFINTWCHHHHQIKIIPPPPNITIRVHFDFHSHNNYDSVVILIAIHNQHFLMAYVCLRVSLWQLKQWQTHTKTSNTVSDVNIHFSIETEGILLNQTMLTMLMSNELRYMSCKIVHSFYFKLSILLQNVQYWQIIYLYLYIIILTSTKWQRQHSIYQKRKNKREREL